MTTSLDRFIEALQTRSRMYVEYTRNNRPRNLENWKAITKLAKRLGIRFIHPLSSEHFSKSRLQWDGKHLCVDEPDNLLHDIAHFQVAGPDRRFKPDYGLGDGPDSLDKETAKMLVSSQEAQTEEERASILGIIWEARFNLEFPYTIAYHGWRYDDCAKEAIAWLKDNKLVVNGEPRICLREG